MIHTEVSHEDDRCRFGVGRITRLFERVYPFPNLLADQETALCSSFDTKMVEVSVDDVDESTWSVTHS